MQEYNSNIIFYKYLSRFIIFDLKKLHFKRYVIYIYIYLFIYSLIYNFRKDKNIFINRITILLKQYFQLKIAELIEFLHHLKNFFVQSIFVNLI